MGLLSCIAIGTSSPIPVLHILIQHHLPLLYLLILLFLKCMSNQCLEPSVHDLWNASHNLLPLALFNVKISEKKCGLLVYSLVNGHWLSNSTIHALGYIDLINIFYYHIVCFDQFGFLLLLQLSWTTKIRPKTLDWVQISILRWVPIFSVDGLLQENTIFLEKISDRNSTTKITKINEGLQHTRRTENI